MSPQEDRLVPLDEAQHFVQAKLSALSPIALPLDEALGCVAFEEMVAREAVPGFSNSAMDGYALRSVDTAEATVRLRVVGSILTGEVPDVHLEQGQAVRIMTGAPIPDGADCVCKLEEVSVDSAGRVVQIDRVVSIGENVRHPGEDVAAGQVLLTPGSELGPVLVGLLASQGCTAVMVHPRPRVGVLSTGNELVDVSGPLEAGKIRDTNRPMLLATLRRAGFSSVDLGSVGDDATSIGEALRRGILECDAVISTGGVSVGDADFFKTALAELCGEEARSMQVAIRPGRPFAFGVAGPRKTPVFGLAGNPVATLVGFELLVRPALRLLAGHRILERPTLDAVLDAPLPRRRDGKLHLVYVTATFRDDGRLHARSVVHQRSHMLSAIANGNAIAMVEDGDGLEVGEAVRTIILDSDQSVFAPT